MAVVETHPLIRYVRHLAWGQRGAVVPDELLLDRFAIHRDEAAFTALVRRHGPLVLAVCRRVLEDRHEAEDAFQATFFILARKAGLLRQPGRLGPWLYGVAVRTARKARAQRARRHQVERQAAVDVIGQHRDDVVWRDLRPVLDEAVAALPESYRVPFVLHHLEGATVAEVASRLGRPQGTVAAQLARAKERLRARLARKGITLSTAALSAALSGSAASAGVPAPLLVSTARAAVVAQGQGVSAGAVATTATVLAQGGGKVMLLTKGKVAVGLVLALAAALGGVSLWEQRPSAALAAGGNNYPELPRDKRELLSDQVARIKFQQAEKDYQIAEFYRRTGQPGSACFYYQLVRNRYPDSDFAAKAAERLHELGEPAEAKQESPKRMPPAEDDPPATVTNPFAPTVPTAAQLIAYLNESARRVPVLHCDNLTIDAREGQQSIGLVGQMAIQQPHNVRVIFKVLGQPALDLCSNDQGWWCWRSRTEPPELLHARRPDLVRRAATDWPCPVGPEDLVWIMGMRQHDPATPVEVIAQPDTLELVEKAWTPQGKPLRKVTVFHRGLVAPPRSQVQGFRVEDTEKKVLLRVEVREVAVDRATGAVVPTRLVLSWPDQKMKIDARLQRPEVCATLKQERAIRLFGPPPGLTQPRPKP
jgi:RNA polymerase sigma factor (sigma-70 family)